MLFFSFEKGSDGQMLSSSDLNHTIECSPPCKISHPPLLEGNSKPPFNAIWKTMLCEVVMEI